MAQALDQGNCGIARSRGKEAEVKPVSRRTEMPYKADGADELAKHSEVRCSAPEVNGAVVPGPFTFLLREICSWGSPETAGTAASNGRWLGAEVSRGRSTEGHEPDTKTPEGLTTREGLNLAGNGDHRWSCPRVDAGGLSEGRRSSWQRKSLASSFGTARNRRTRTRMSGGVGGGR